MQEGLVRVYNLTLDAFSSHFDPNEEIAGIRYMGDKSIKIAQIINSQVVVL
jgi:hypothetical protein